MAASVVDEMFSFAICGNCLFVKLAAPFLLPILQLLQGEKSAFGATSLTTSVMFLFNRKSRAGAALGVRSLARKEYPENLTCLIVFIFVVNVLLLANDLIFPLYVV